MIATTLKRILAHHPCYRGWTKLLVGLGKTKADDEPLPFATILSINGIEDALWATRCEPEHDPEWRLYAVACARRVQHSMTDPRSLAALGVAERFALGKATKAELSVAWAAARDAAKEAAWAAALAAESAAAAKEAAWAAAWAVECAAAAKNVAWAAAWAVETAWQTEEFLRTVGDLN